MAQAVVCDVCGSPDGSCFVTASWNDRAFAADLCREHQAMAEDAFRSIFGDVRPVFVPLLPDLIHDVAVGKPPPYPAAAGLDLGVVRKWAMENGLPVAERGRISVKIIDAYRQAVG